MNAEIRKKVLQIEEDIKILGKKDIIPIRLDEKTVEDIHMTLSSLNIIGDKKEYEYEKIFEALTILAIKQGLESIWNEKK